MTERRYRLTYDSGAGITVWEKTAEELLVPNGTEPLIAWMLRECDARGGRAFTLELMLPPGVDVVLFRPSGKYYTTERWRIPEDAIVPADMRKSPDFRRIDGGPVLVPPQEPWGYEHLFPGVQTDV